MTTALIRTAAAEAIDDDVAAHGIAEAIGVRHSIARKYVLRLRRRHPDATPVEVVGLLERHYVVSITAAGTAIAAGGLAASIGISLIPGGGAAAVGAKAAGREVAKKAMKATLKEATKAAAKDVALTAARGGAQRAAGLLPAGEQQLQFEITAIFGLAIADIHGIEYDRNQAQALVWGLTSERISSVQLATMAEDVARTSPASTSAQRDEEAGSANWASTLADALPGGAARRLVRTMQTGQLDGVRDSMTGKQQDVVQYGVTALAGGISRFVFGQAVVDAARVAFPDAPDVFPAQLAVVDGADDGDEPSAALAALEGAANATGTWLAEAASTVGGGVADGAAAVGDGVATAADSATRIFRNVDLDGDGVPDEARALTAARDAGDAIAGVAGALGGGVTGLFRRRKRA